MQTKTEYRLLAARDNLTQVACRKLSEDITQCQEEGWEPFGNHALSTLYRSDGHSLTIVTQMMVKHSVVPQGAPTIDSIGQQIASTNVM